MIYLPNIRRKNFQWDLRDETILHYKCNDDAANTTVTDSGTGGTNGISSTNTSNLSVAGKINDAFDFAAASTEDIDCNQTFQTTFRAPFSVAGWIKPNDGQPAGNQVICGSANIVAEDRFFLYIETGGKVTAFYGSNGNSTQATTNAAFFPNGATAWTWALFTVDASNVKIYLNNTVIALDAVNDGDMSGITMGDFTTVDNLHVGASNVDGTPTLYWDGLMDDFRVISKVIVPVERSGIWNGGLGTESLYG